MIHTCIPYCPPENGKNLGQAYNTHMKMIGDDDWSCFIDHDAMFTTNNWYTQIQKIIANADDRKIGLLTAVTNRIGNVEQIIFAKDSKESTNHDIYFHRKIGKDILFADGESIREAVGLISGVVMVVPKKVWIIVGGFDDGFLGVDRKFDSKVRKSGYKTYIMNGVYVYHWYRAAPEDGGLKPCGYPENGFLAP